MRRIYLITRDLHLYVGLFLSPFILVFSISVFYLVHGLALRPAPDSGRSFAYSHQSERSRRTSLDLGLYLLFFSWLGRASERTARLSSEPTRTGDRSQSRSRVRPRDVAGTVLNAWGVMQVLPHVHRRARG
jgi:hypothetical protein